jgi:hypothetical protein
MFFIVRGYHSFTVPVRAQELPKEYASNWKVAKAASAGTDRGRTSRQKI